MLLIVTFLALNTLLCSGLPLYYDEDSALAGEALNASLAKVNAQSFGRSLFGVVQSFVRSADFMDEDTYTLVLDFTVRETECAKDSGRDPASCEFQWGRYAQVASCKSWAQVSEEHVQHADVHCHRADSSSESSSSEEMFWGRMGLNRGRHNGNFASTRYGKMHSAGKRNMLSQKPQNRPPSRNWDQFE